MSTTIGIDLGTTNSEVAIIREGVPLVLSVDGSPLVPSAVSQGPDGGMLVGRSALNNELAAPLDTVRWIKRKMGTDETVMIGGKVFSPAMVSSLILAHLKRAAEAFLGETVIQAVITVPAFFSEKAREDTREAARLAGLEVLRLLNEPTAAAAAYAMGSRVRERWLVYDLGGGTFDVSIVDCSQEVMEVRASHGDVLLGGHDFDRQIAERAVSFFKTRHEIDLKADPRAWARVMRSAEAAKIRLSSEPSAVLREEFIAKKDGVDLHLEHTLTRPELEEMIRPAIERTLDSVRIALREASCLSSAISRVILVGGSTRIPLVAQLLREELKLDPQAWINPDTVVAQGAAIEAASLGGVQLGAMMVDITPHSLGTPSLGEDDILENVILIHRNTPLPCVASRIFYKLHDEQDKVLFGVTQGESPIPERNTNLGEFQLEGLAASHQREIHCKFELDRSGLLHVSVTHLGSGVAMERTLQPQAAPRRANLADLAAVTLAGTVEVSGSEADDGYAQARPADLDAVAETDATVATSEDGAVDAGLIEQAKRLLAKGDLDPMDRNDLTDRLERALAGTPEALERLRDLVYFLE